MLVEFYRAQATAKNFEIVFVSSDGTKAAFERHRADMPWLAVPFAQRGLRTALGARYQSCVPSLTVLGPDGSVVTTEGIPNLGIAARFSSLSCPLEQPAAGEVERTLGSALLKRNGSATGVGVLGGGVFGVYFGAAWCPPCREFAACLKTFYDAYRDAEPDFQVVFVSSDTDERAMMRYFQEEHGDYLALPFSRRKDKACLSRILGVQGIPSFVVVDAAGRVLNSNARSRVTAGALDVLANGWAPTESKSVAGGVGRAASTEPVCRRPAVHHMNSKASLDTCPATFSI